MSGGGGSGLSIWGKAIYCIGLDWIGLEMSLYSVSDYETLDQEIHKVTRVFLHSQY